MQELFDVLRNMGKQYDRTGPGFDSVARQKEHLSHGPFAEATKRQGAFTQSDEHNFETPLTAEEEVSFQGWKQQYAPHDSGADYDLRGAFKAGLKPDALTNHWPDTYKKPNHETFSDESIYSSLTGTKPGHWIGNNFTPFVEAGKRQSLWTDPSPGIQVAQLSLNRNERALFDELDKAPASTAFNPASPVNTDLPITKRPSLEGIAEADRLRAQRFKTMEDQDNAKLAAERAAKRRSVGIAY